MNISMNLSVWTAFVFTLAVFSGLYRENPLYKFAESVFIGVSAGYFASVWFFSVLIPVFDDTMNGDYILLVPVISGLLLFIPSDGQKKYSKFVFMPSVFIVMLYLAVNIPVYFQAYVYEMIRSSMIPLVSFAEDGNIRWDLTINAVVNIVGIISVLFFLVARHRKVNGFLSAAGETGRFYLLVAIGVSFGYTLVSRIILLMGRFDFVITDLLGFRF